MFLHKSYIWEKSCSWDIDQNALSPSDYMIFKWTISPEQIEQIWSQDSKFTVCQKWTEGINWFFACWYKFMQIKRWFKILRTGLMKNGCGQSCGRALNLTVFEGWIDEINWFFACWYRFTKIKSWSKIYWVGIVKNGCGQSGHGTLNNITWFFAC